MMDDSKLSDAELLALVSAGNADAEEALAERYSRLVRICARPLFLIGGGSHSGRNAWPALCHPAV